MFFLALFSLSACLLFESAEVDFPSGHPPIVEILSPEDGAALYQYNRIQLVAEIIDKEDPTDTLSIALTSSLDEAINIDEANIIDSSFEVDFNLSAGTHTLMLSVKDPSGLQSTDEIQVTINEDNTPPICTLSTPTDGDSVSGTEDLIASGYASDLESPMEDLIVVFRSDIDGMVGTTNPSTDGIIEMPIALSDNIHQLTMTVTDPGNQSCEITHTIVVSNGPMVTITYPSDGTIFYPDDNFAFEAIVQDSDADPTDIQIEWSSSIDGTLWQDTPDSNGSSYFIANPLSPGEHVITFTATDSANAVGMDSINLIVNLPPVIDLIEFLPENVSPNEPVICRAEASNPDGDPPTLSFELQNQSTGTVYSPTLVQSDHVMLELSTVNDVQAGDVIICTVTATDEYNSSITRDASVTIITRDGGTTVSPTE